MKAQEAELIRGADSYHELLARPVFHGKRGVSARSNPEKSTFLVVVGVVMFFLTIIVLKRLVPEY
ncbi:MAG: hypothetical protein HQL67_04250 [Magnetococcales bacterium]|nr:hypothetical protein [Magnetococcales bacterium]